MAIIHFIKDGHEDISKIILAFAERHLFEIDIHLSIEDFLSTYAGNRHQKPLTKFEDFQEWVRRFHLVIGYWKTRKEFREAGHCLRTWEPRIVRRLLFSQVVSLEKRLETIFDVSSTEAVSFECLKGKNLSELRRKFGTIIFMSFHRFMETHTTPAENMQTTLSMGDAFKTVKDPRKVEVLRLIRLLSVFRDKKREGIYKLEFGKAFPALLWGDDRESDTRFADRWFKAIKESKYKPSDFQVFFDHCPWCSSQDVEVRFFKSPQWTWTRHLCGRANWIVQCAGCKRILLSVLVCMS